MYVVKQYDFNSGTVFPANDVSRDPSVPLLFDFFGSEMSSICQTSELVETQMECGLSKAFY